MSSQRTLPALGLAKIACCLLVLICVFTMPFARYAHASYYKMVICAANVGSNGFESSTNTVSATNPGGIFQYENYCGPAPYPAGNAAFLRLVEIMPNGTAGNGAYGRMTWTAPPYISIAAGGGYTREPGEFNLGWRARFWAEGYDGSANNILIQGVGVENGSLGGIGWSATSTFASHLWPFGSYGSYRSFVFEMTCVREAGCDRTGFNGVDANSFQLVLNDVSPPSLGITGSLALAAGQWVRGESPVLWDVTELGSGLRWERVRIDGGQVFQYDHRSVCDLDANGATGEFARVFQPCPRGGPYSHSYLLNTATLADGVHTLQVCAQDYGQAVGLSGSGGESCDERTIRSDNQPPGAPSGLKIETSNPARYLDRFDASWRLPADPGSPIAKVHYDIVDAAGQVVAPERTLTATNPTTLDGVKGPASPGDYRLRVWFEDGVGLSGPAASVAIPHDTTPPAAPQGLSVTSPGTSRSQDGFDVRWQNIVDAGAPVSAVHYQVLDGAGQVVVDTQSVGGENPQTIQNLEAPRERGEYTLRLWLSDAEGNVGAPAAAPLAYSCVRSAASGGQRLSAGVGEQSSPAITVRQGKVSVLAGSLAGAGNPTSNAAVCVFSRVITDPGREFLGVAMTGPSGEYRFPVSPGPSRELTSVYRFDQREIEAKATIKTRVIPALKIRPRIVRNKHAAVFELRIPAPHNDNVVLVLQVKHGHGWRAFRRCRTRSGGRCIVHYRFTQTWTPTLYKVRAQARFTVGYPFEQGNSKTLPLRVMP